MTRPVPLHVGYGRLAIDAVTGVVDVVESMHATIAAPLAGDRRLRTGGISRFVYASVRGVTNVVGDALTATLGALPVPPRFFTATRGVRAALNGVCGDHLERTRNPLASPLELLPDAEHAAAEHLLVLVHGLCLDETCWRRGDAGHGDHLARKLGATPVYVRYNTGLRIATNGLALAEEIEQLVAMWPVPVARITLLGHSMGGLVLRSACAHAEGARLGWRAKVATLATLGTPHAGAPLERLGHGVDRALRATRFSAPLAAIGASRSAGISDLRHGRVHVDDEPLPLPAGVRCFAVAGMIGEAKTSLAKLRGDGLVPLDSALGGALAFAPADTLVVHDTDHFDLLSDQRVRRRLTRWLRR